MSALSFELYPNPKQRSDESANAYRNKRTFASGSAPIWCPSNDKKAGGIALQRQGEYHSAWPFVGLRACSSAAGNGASPPVRVHEDEVISPRAGRISGTGDRHPAGERTPRCFREPAA